MIKITSLIVWLPFFLLAFLTFAMMTKRISMVIGKATSISVILLVVIWLFFFFHHGIGTQFSTTIFTILVSTYLLFLVSAVLQPVMRKLIYLVNFYAIYLSFIGAASFALLPNISQQNDMQGSWLYFHVGLAVITYGFFSIAALAAVAVFIKEYSLKRKIRLSFIENLPSVFDCNQIQINLMIKAEFLLFISILSGFINNYFLYNTIFQYDHKILLTFLTFVSIALILLLYFRFGVRGGKIGQWILLSYFFITLAYPGVKLISEIIHFS